MCHMTLEQKSHLPEYRGSLDPAAVAKGMNAANRNARRLVADAKLLLDGERYPSAAALAALAIEESGQSVDLARLGGC